MSMLSIFKLFQSIIVLGRCFSHNSACVEVDKSWSSILKNRDETAKGH